MLKALLQRTLSALCLLILTAWVAPIAPPELITTTLSDYAHLSAPQVFDRNPTAVAENYLADVTKDGRMTWPLQQMPLHVYIEDGTGTPGYRQSYPDLIRHAFDEWQNISSSTLTWKEVSSPQDADIVCSWTAEARPKGNGVEAGETATTIARNPWFSGGRIVSAHVMVLTYLFGHPFSKSDIYKTCLHEIGHALGMQGHSSTVGDIMYPVLNPNQTPYLKARDRNTITALYAQNDGRNSLAFRNYGQLIARRRFIDPGNRPLNNFNSRCQQMQMPPGNSYARGWVLAPTPNL